MNLTLSEARELVNELANLFDDWDIYLSQNDKDAMFRCIQDSMDSNG